MHIRAVAVSVTTTLITLGSVANAAALPAKSVPKSTAPASHCIAVASSPGHPGGIYCQQCVGINALPGHPGGIHCWYVRQP
jgi:hypothetical protein